ncbi:MAG: bifunctional diaminohydroxyphosphoribosylaminopyrimidine deaminase/5-amino-6-(5-phosphoribosylamino)uracil reductase RibD [Betaproteobacteria bacterium]
MFSAFDHAMMAHAIRLAEFGRCITSPNPFVGCVIVKQGRIIGEGFTQKSGRPHAEAVALDRCSVSPEGATVYSTLEPCCLHPKSRGPACSDLLVAAKVARVVSAIPDPFDGVDGGGHSRLRDAGITVETGLMEAVVRTQLRAFLSRVSRRRPWVTLKVAASLDGKTALANGRSKWITGAEARRDVHRMRAEACAVMTGIGTLIADNPRLTVRDVPCGRQPLRIFLDSRLEVPDDARIFDGGNVLVVTAEHNDAREKQLHSLGAAVLRVPQEAVKGKVDLLKLMASLASRGLNSVMVEAGAKLNGSLIAAGVVDEIVTYVAPSVFGDSARGIFALPEFTELSQCVAMEIIDVRRIGTDLRITATVKGR